MGGIASPSLRWLDSRWAAFTLHEGKIWAGTWQMEAFGHLPERLGSPWPPYTLCAGRGRARPGFGEQRAPVGLRGPSLRAAKPPRLRLGGFSCRLRAPAGEGEAGAGGVPAAQRQRGPAAAGRAAGAGAGQRPGAGGQGGGRAAEEAGLRGEGGAAAGSPGPAPGRLRETGAARATAPHPPGAGAEDAAGSAGGCR